MVRERIEVRSSGRMEGNIVCQKIAIAEGAFMDGEVHTHKGKPLSPEYFTEKRKRPADHEISRWGGSARQIRRVFRPGTGRASDRRGLGRTKVQPAAKGRPLLLTIRAKTD